MNYSMGLGIIRYMRFEDIFEVPCASKFSALRSSVRFEVPCASKFRALRSSVWEPYGSVNMLTIQVTVSVMEVLPW